MARFRRATRDPNSVSRLERGRVPRGTTRQQTGARRLRALRVTSESFGRKTDTRKRAPGRYAGTGSVSG